MKTKKKKYFLFPCAMFIFYLKQQNINRLNRISRISRISRKSSSAIREIANASHAIKREFTSGREKDRKVLGGHPPSVNSNSYLI